MLRKEFAAVLVHARGAVGIIVIGINFILNPVGAATGYGIPIHDPRRLSLHVDQGHSRHLFGFGSPVVPLERRPAHNRNNSTHFQFSSRSAMGWSFCDIWALRPLSYSLGHNALHDDRCAFLFRKQKTMEGLS